MRIFSYSKALTIFEISQEDFGLILTALDERAEKDSNDLYTRLLEAIQ